MRYWHRHSGLRALLAVLVLTAQAACTSWRVQQAAPAEVFRERSPKSVRLTLTDSTRLQLSSPTLRNDSLIGLTNGHRTGTNNHPNAFRGNDSSAVVADDTSRVALADIQTVAVKKRAPLKAVGLTFGILGGLFAVAAAACANDCYTIDLIGAEWNEYFATYRQATGAHGAAHTARGISGVGWEGSGSEPARARTPRPPRGRR